MQTCSASGRLVFPALAKLAARRIFANSTRSLMSILIPRPTTAQVGKVLLALCALPGMSCLAAATVSPTSLSWVSVVVGGRGAQKVVTLTNSGTTAITISSIALSGANPGDFVIFSKTCGTSLAAAASCTANILFAPTVTGARTATLSFTDTATNSPQTVAVSGTGTAAATLTQKLSAASTASAMRAASTASR